MILQEDTHRVVARDDLDVTVATPDEAFYGFHPELHYIRRGNFPNIQRGWRWNRSYSRWDAGTLPALAVNPKSAWSEELEDARTFTEFKRLLMSDTAFLALLGYMPPAQRHAHDRIRGGGGRSPSAPASPTGQALADDPLIIPDNGESEE